MTKISKKDQEILNQCLRCAFLCAVGDTELAEEEADDLMGGIQSVLQGVHTQRKAIEHFEETKDFEAAVALKKSDPVIVIDGGSMLFGGLPPFLDDIYEQRGEVKNVEELIALEKLQASKITIPFYQKLAVLVSHYVCINDGQVSDGELVSIRNMCDIWDLNYYDIIGNWNEKIVAPIITGEKPDIDPDDSNSMSETAASLLDEVMDKALKGEDVDIAEIVLNKLQETGILDSDVDSENLLPIISKKNNFKQSFACIYCCPFGSGELLHDEADELNHAANMLSDLYNWSSEESTPLDIALEAVEEVHNSFIGIDGWQLGDTLPKELMVKNIKQLSKKITDDKLKKMILYLGREVAQADGIDEDEETVIESLRDSWKIEWAEVDAAFKL